MNPAPQREEALFQAASQLTGPARTAFLDQACARDSALRQRLDALLAAHEQPETLLVTQAEAARPTIKLDLADAPDEAVGQTLGRYKLLERVGEGGCGVVYVAEQTEPVRRRVALKVIKLGMDTKQVVARFEAERQALAMMDHPNIAKVLDAGMTLGAPASRRPVREGEEKFEERAGETPALPGGRPYFVMELVRGIKITDYCDQANLSTKERLDLFIKVCHAIQHAHQKGIIHRDIKPSNILVTLHDGVPVPKVIDFGIAKATEGRLTDNTVYTQLHQFIGTPAYMSPEQAEMSGLDIDTRSDIYSLGVLLYELLAGSTPFDAKELMASGIDAMRKTIREKEPQRPSTRLATLGADQLTTTAKRRSADTSKLMYQLKGDLDWIVMKCLEKDRTRRYETANGLAQDIQRFLKQEAIAARPPSTLYRFRKLVRRNKIVFTMGSAVAATLVVGLGISLALYSRERKARMRADKAEQAQAALRREAESRAELGQKMGMAGLLLSQGRYEEAENLIAQVPLHPASSAIYNAIGVVHARRGHWPAAITNLTRVVELVPTDHEAYHSLAPLLAQNGDIEAYRKLCGQILRRFAETTNSLIAERMSKDCLILSPPTADLAIIDRMADTAVAAGPQHPTWRFFQFAKGLSEYRLGQFDRSSERMQKVVAESPGANLQAEGKFVLAMAQHRLGKFNESRATFAGAVEIVNARMARAGKDLGDNWTDWIIAHLLMAEAKSLIEGGPKVNDQAK